MKCSVCKRNTWCGSCGVMFDLWQPIATAPKDQIRVIGAIKDLVIGDIYFGKGCLQIVRLGESGYQEERLKDAWRESHSGDRLPDHWQHTHWMPLPEPPKGGAT